MVYNIGNFDVDVLFLADEGTFNVCICHDSGNQTQLENVTLEKAMYAISDEIECRVEDYGAIKTEGLTLSRAKELLNAMIDHACVAESTEDVIKELLSIGFTSEELIRDFGFTSTDVEYAEGAGDDDGVDIEDED